MSLPFFANAGVNSETEYAEALRSAVVFDRSTTGKIELTGEDAPSFLHNLCTNDINQLPVGGGCEAYFCDHRAKVLAHARIYHLKSGEQHSLWLDVAPGGEHAARLFAHLDRHLISEDVQLQDRAGDSCQIHLAGPQGLQILRQATSSDLPEIPEFLHLSRDIAGVSCQIRRHDPLGLAGYDVVLPVGDAARVLQSLADNGAVPAGENVYELLRVEAGTPVYGIDIDIDRFVMELPRALRAVSYAKGCYLGQEPIVMARDRAGFVNRTLLGLKVLEGNSPLPPSSRVLRNDTEVGRTTSSVVSPRLGTPLCLAYLRRGHQEPGLRLEVETKTGRCPVEVLPFPPVG